MRSIRVYLDTALRDKQASTPDRYVWNVRFGSSQALDGVHVLNGGDIQNICGIKTCDMLIYNNNDSAINTPNLNIQVAEFATDAMQNGPVRYHFSIYTDQSMLCRIKNKGEYWFEQIFSQMPSTLSLTFFNEWSQLPFPTNALLYIDKNYDTITCSAAAYAQGQSIVLHDIVSGTPGTQGHPAAGYNNWAQPFFQTDQFVNSILNTTAMIYVTITTDNPADAAEIAAIESYAWITTKVTHDASGNATVTIAADPSNLIGQITGATFTAVCPYAWFTAPTLYNDVVYSGTLIYIRNFTSNLPNFNVPIFNALINRQEGWQYRPVGDLYIYILLGVAPPGNGGMLSLSTVGQIDSLRLIVPLEIFYNAGETPGVHATT